MAKTQSESPIKRIPPQLGIRFDEKVRGYFFGLVNLGLLNPDEAFKRLRDLPDVVEYAIPDPRMTQARMQEMLLRIEILARAAQVILTYAGPDLFERFIVGFLEPLSQKLPDGRAPTGTEMAAIGADIEKRFGDTLNEIFADPEPPLKAAMKIWINFGKVTDLEGPRPGPQTLRAIGWRAPAKRKRRIRPKGRS